MRPLSRGLIRALGVTSSSLWRSDVVGDSADVMTPNNRLSVTRQRHIDRTLMTSLAAIAALWRHRFKRDVTRHDTVRSLDSDRDHQVAFRDKYLLFEMHFRSNLNFCALKRLFLKWVFFRYTPVFEDQFYNFRCTERNMISSIISLPMIVITLRLSTFRSFRRLYIDFDCAEDLFRSLFFSRFCPWFAKFIAGSSWERFDVMAFPVQTF